MCNRLKMFFISSSSSYTMCFIWSITSYIPTSVISLIKNSKGHRLCQLYPLSSQMRGRYALLMVRQICASDGGDQEVVWRIEIVNIGKHGDNLKKLAVEVTWSREEKREKLEDSRGDRDSRIFNLKIWLCSHIFHFPCMSNHKTKQPLHVCPVCCTNWKELPVLSIQHEKSENRD
ncbi:hypothetical protein MTR_6g055480 [Medicago truncatula]|uniref:Uncharacterized protein n=1 Tax=Medicago truncatula TaxID=3880 RepID=G7KM02_MEDTR|nr:hypothetical protein MTR_6g055480 [Medicago truncatula]